MEIVAWFLLINVLATVACIIIYLKGKSQVVQKVHLVGIIICISIVGLFTFIINNYGGSTNVLDWIILYGPLVVCIFLLVRIIMKVPE